MRNINGLIMSAAMMMAGAGSPGMAATYVTEASFLAAHSGASTTPFTNLYKPYASYRYLTSPTGFGPLTISGTSLIAVRAGYQYAKMAYVGSNAYQGFVKVAFAPTQAVGFYFATPRSTTYPLDFTAYDKNSVLFTTTISGGSVRNGFAYFGIDGIGAITSFKLDAKKYPGADAPELGTVSLASGAAVAAIAAATSAAAVPEPSTWAMLLCGFGAVGLARRRARQSVTTGTHTLEIDATRAF